MHEKGLYPSIFLVLVGDLGLKSPKREISIPKHTHCIVCGVSIAENEMFCSNKCRDEYQRMMKRQKYMRLSAFIPVIVVIIMFVILFLLKSQ
jgi:predicted nucleic acid-binding Zn ribbon protein